MMRFSILWILVLRLSTNFCSAQQAFQFQDITLDEALQKSAAGNKPVFLMLYQSTCGHCEKMLNEVMSDSSVAAFYNTHFIEKKVEMLSDPDAPKYAKQFSVQSFPTFVILDKSMNVLFQYVGEFKKQDFIDIAQLALQPAHQLPYLKNEYFLHLSDSVACYNYLLALARGRLATQPVVNQYFNAVKDSFDYSAYNWKIFSMGVSDMQSDIFQFISSHRDEFAKVATIKKVERKLYLTAAYNLQTSSFANDTVGFQKAVELSKNLHLHQVDSLVFVTELSFYEKIKNWTGYTSSAANGADQYVWDDALTLRRISETIYEHAEDKSQLQKAANCAVRAAELKPDYYNNLNAAKIYLKIGYKDFAKKYAEKAKDLGLEKGINVSEANLVLQQCSE